MSKPETSTPLEVTTKSLVYRQTVNGPLEDEQGLGDRCAESGRPMRQEPESQSQFARVHDVGGVQGLLQVPDNVVAHTQLSSQ